jgi:predicted transcriptional regulator
VYTIFGMKNITLSADENLIEQARLIARSQHKTLNAVFREWLLQFTAQSGRGHEFDALMKRLKHVKAGRHFTRDEMNER